MRWSQVVGLGAGFVAALGPAARASADARHLERPSLVLGVADTGHLGGLSHADVLAAARDAAAVWNDVACADVSLQVTSVSSNATAKDGTNVIALRSRAWCQNDRCGGLGTYPAGAAAFTTTYPQSGAIQEADIELNATRDWSKETVTLVLVHELGHVLGFEEACLSGVRNSYRVDRTCAATDSVMFSPAGHARLSADDAAALCRAYPKAHEDSSGLARLGWPWLLLASAFVGIQAAHSRRRRRRAHQS